MNNPKAIVDSIVRQWTDWANQTGMKKAVLGMSGGCDSYVAAKLATLVFGKENVIGVMMPKGRQSDIDDALRACHHLGITHQSVDIEDAFNAISGSLFLSSRRARVNLQPRIRMCILYFIAQQAGEEGAHVITTSNRSEIAVGYTTLWGDSVGDYAPLADITKTTVRAVGMHLGLDPDLVNKVPTDGLSGNSDEHALGFTYEELDTWLDRGITGPNIHKIVSKIDAAEFKRNLLKNIPHPIIGETK